MLRTLMQACVNVLRAYGVCTFMYGVCTPYNLIYLSIPVPLYQLNASTAQVRAVLRRGGSGRGLRGEDDVRTLHTNHGASDFRYFDRMSW